MKGSAVRIRASALASLAGGALRAPPRAAPGLPASGPCVPALFHSHTGPERRARKPRAGRPTRRRTGRRFVPKSARKILDRLRSRTPNFRSTRIQARSDAPGNRELEGLVAKSAQKSLDRIRCPTPDFRPYPSFKGRSEVADEYSVLIEQATSVRARRGTRRPSVCRKTLATAGVVFLALLTFPPLASGAVTCVFAGSTATVSMSAAGDTASIAVGTGANAGRIMVGAAACGRGHDEQHRHDRRQRQHRRGRVDDRPERRLRSHPARPSRGRARPRSSSRSTSEPARWTA